MFDKQYRFKGLHALKVDKLNNVFDAQSGAKLFNRNVDIYANDFSCNQHRIRKKNHRSDK